MPTYQFHCRVCAHHFEERRSFAASEDPATCPACASEEAEKVIGTAMFFTPGSAAKAILDPSAKTRAAAKATAAHAPGCPCCRV